MSGDEDMGPLEEIDQPGGWGLEGQGQMPSVEDILRFIDNATGITEEEREQIKSDFLKSRMEGSEAAQYTEEIATAAAAGGLLAPSTLLFIGLVLLIALTLGLFVYMIIKNEKNKLEAKNKKKAAKDAKKKKNKRN